MIGEPAFEGPHGLVVGLALADLSVVVATPWAGAHPDLGDRDDVQGVVELPVTAARQPVAGAVSAGHLDRCDTGVVRERRGRREPARPPGPSEQPGCDDRADAVDLKEPAAVLGERLR